jgi:hypothetical protein
MRPKFTFSEEVRVVRAIRNDGTVAGFAARRAAGQARQHRLCPRLGRFCRIRLSTRSTFRKPIGSSAAANRS